MSRRDFAILAEVLRQAQADYEAGDQIEPATVAARLAVALEGQNPRFDRKRFLRAAGVI